MGNENSSEQITYNNNGIKGKNQIARGILENNVKGIPSNEQIAGAIAIQQYQDTGPLKKTDLIAILIRLNPDKNNALLSQYKIEDLLKSIRHEVYVKPFSGVKQERPVKDVKDVKVINKYNEQPSNIKQLQNEPPNIKQLQYEPPNIKQLQYEPPNIKQLQYEPPNIKQLQYHK
jgi:hypothetical protein